MHYHEFDLTRFAGLSQAAVEFTIMAERSYIDDSAVKQMEVRLGRCCAEYVQ